MNLPIFKIRASASGKLMTAPRNKTEVLSETTKSYLKEWLISKKFGYENIITSKYTERGTISEDFAIDFAIQVLDLPFAIKNEKTFEDDYFCGTPDLIVDGIVYDIKCSWSCFTFPIFDKEIPNKDYFYQLQVYMYLTGCKKAVLTYVLLDNENIGHEYDVDNKERIKTFEIDFDEKIIETLKTKVLQSREYLTNLI